MLLYQIITALILIIGILGLKLRKMTAKLGAYKTSIITLRQAVKRQKPYIQYCLKLVKDLRLKALYDPVTGLPNRTLFDNRLKNIFKKRDRTEYSLFNIDLNNFKQVNDTYGHLVGDATLAKVASILLSSIRPEDTAARVGGDEFAMLLKTDRSRRIAQRLTIGAVRMAANIKDIPELLGISDLAMYGAKSKCKSTNVINYQQWGAPIRG